MELIARLANLPGALPGACAQGLIWGIMAMGVYITYRILDVADLTVDGSLATGGYHFRRPESDNSYDCFPYLRLSIEVNTKCSVRDAKLAVFSEGNKRLNHY